jgi:hypothetical protein
MGVNIDQKRTTTEIPNEGFLLHLDNPAINRSAAPTSIAPDSGLYMLKFAS